MGVNCGVICSLGFSVYFPNPPPQRITMLGLRGLLLAGRHKGISRTSSASSCQKGGVCQWRAGESSLRLVITRQKDLLEVCNNSAQIGQDTYDGECRLVGLRQSRWAYGQRTLECGYP